MRRWIAFLAALVSTFAVFGRPQTVRDVAIEVTLFSSGNALVHERWDVDTGTEITEWYLPRENLGDIEITDFRVFSDGVALSDDGEWDVNRSRTQKAGHFGIVHKYNGVELCWGIGEYGDHIFEPLYVMTNAVKTLNDYDILHLQLVNDELAAPPQHVSVRIKLTDAMEAQLDTTNCRAWGFGFYGSLAFDNGTVVYESSEPLRYESSVIVLLRFNKGLFNSPSIQMKDFDEVLAGALSGAEFDDDPEEEEEDPYAEGIATFFTGLLMWLIFRKTLRSLSGKPSKREKRQMVGMDPNKVDWFRDIPMDGDLIAAEYGLTRFGEDRKRNALASAEILRMIYKGYLEVQKDAEGKIEISFAKSTDGKENLDSIAKDLWGYMLDASGKDRILQDTEFSTWSKGHKEKLRNWTEKASLMGKQTFRDKGWMNARDIKFTPDGQKQMQQLLGFRKYLEDFTLTRNRETIEVHLWQEYLVYGTLMGIAEKVAKQLKDIDPALFEKTVGYDYTTFSGALSSLDSLSRAITSANQTYYASSYAGGGGGSRGGYGGHTSFGGGGGFSGGGHGGGGR